MSFCKFLQISIGILLFIFSPLRIEAATLYLMPSQQSVYEGDTFIVEIRLDAEKEEINAVEANLAFSPDLLEVKDLIKGNSILSFWLREPDFSNKAGIISFVGGTPTGLEKGGLIGSVTFLAKKTGRAKIIFKKDSKTLLSDGKGTLAKLNFSQGNYELIKKPEGLSAVLSESHPDSDKWYKQNNLYLSWDLVEGAGYSYLLSKDSLAGPDDIPDKPEGKMVWMGDIKYLNLENGIYYFTVKQKLPNKDWSATAGFRIMIDAGVPEEFQPKIVEIEKKNYLVFSAIDKISGIDRYEILEIKKSNYLNRFFKKEKKQNWKIGKTPYLLNDQSLKSIIKVKASDKAGNERVAEIFPAEEPFSYWRAILIFVGIGLIWLAIKRISTKSGKTKTRNNAKI